MKKDRQSRITGAVFLERGLFGGGFQGQRKCHRLCAELFFLVFLSSVHLIPPAECALTGIREAPARSRGPGNKPFCPPP